MRPSRPRTANAAGALVQATVAALLAVLGLLIGAGPAAADGDVSWEVSPASGDFGAIRTNYNYTVNPGDQLKDGLLIVNHGTTPLSLNVYAADAFTTEMGRRDLVTKDAKSTRVGVWVHPGQSDVTVQPGASVEVPFTVTLPDDLAPGDYLGGLVTSPNGTADRRRGIQVRLRVGSLDPALSVEDLRVRYSGAVNPFGKGDATVTYTIHNTGNAIVAARQMVSVSGPFGQSNVRAGQIADSPELLPGETWKVSVPVPGVVPLLSLSGKVAVAPLLTDAANSTSSLTAVETSNHAWAVPWIPLVLLLVILCVLVVAGLAFRRRRRA
jgi:hypothetical protein